MEVSSVRKGAGIGADVVGGLPSPRHSARNAEVWAQAPLHCGVISVPDSAFHRRPRQIREGMDQVPLERSLAQWLVEKGDSNVKTTRRLPSSEWFGIAQGDTGGFCLPGTVFWATM